MTDWALKWQLQKDKKFRKKKLKEWEGQSKPYYKAKVRSVPRKNKKIKKLIRHDTFDINHLSIDSEDLAQIVGLIKKTRLLKQKDKKILIRFFQYRYNERMQVKNCHKRIARYFAITRENARVIKHRAWKAILSRVQKIRENQFEVEAK